MTKENSTHWLWWNLHDVLRGTALTKDKSALFAARFVAWHLLQYRVDLPESLKPPESGAGLSGNQLDEAWHDLSEFESLGSLRYAFESGVAKVSRDLSDTVLSKINDFLAAVILLTPSERRALAAEAVEQIWSSAGSGRKELPLEVSDFVVHSLEPDPGEPVFCPGPAADSLAVAAMRLGARPTIISSNPPVAACLYAIISGEELSVRRGDPYKDPIVVSSGGTSFRMGTINPPFGKMTKGTRELRWLDRTFKVRSFEAYGVELGLRCVRERLAVVVPNGFLFASGPDGDFREHLVREGMIASVVSFPAGLLSGTSIPFTVLLLKPSTLSREITLCKVDEQRHVTGQGKVRSHDRKFIGADEVLKILVQPDNECAREVGQAEIEEQGFNLTVDRYLSQPLEMLADPSRRVVPLGDLVDIVKPQFLRADEGPDGKDIQEAIPSELPQHGYLASVKRVRRVDAAALKSKGKQVLRNNDVLLSTKGTIGTVAIARPDPESSVPLLTSQASVILRLKQSDGLVDPRCLLLYLRSPIVQQALDAFATGGTIPNISLRDLKSLPVWIPDSQEQEKLVKVFEEQADIQEEISVLAQRREKIAAETWHSLGLVPKSWSMSKRENILLTKK